MRGLRTKRHAANFIWLAGLISLVAACDSKSTSSSPAAPAIKYHYKIMSSGGNYYVGTKVDAVLADLRSDDLAAKIRAAKFIEGWSDLGCIAAIPDLIGFIHSDREPLSIPAIGALSNLAYKASRDDDQLPAMKEAIDPLIKVLQHPYSDERRRWAAIAIRKIAPNVGRHAVQQVVPALTAAAQQYSYKDCPRFSIDALGSFGASAVKAVPALVEIVSARDQATGGPNINLCVNAADALGKISKEPTVCIPAMVQLLAEAEVLGVQDWQRCNIVESIAEFGQHAHSAIPTLLPLLKDGSQEMRRTAAIAIQQIDSEDSTVRQAVFETLDQLSGSGIYHWNDIFNPEKILLDLKSDEPMKKLRAVSVMPSLLTSKTSGDHELDAARRAMPYLVNCLDSNNEELVREAITSLGRIGFHCVDSNQEFDELKLALPKLIEHLGNTDGWIREEAAYAVCDVAKSIGPEACLSIVPRLIELTHDNEEGVDQSAISSLGRLGAEAKSAIPTLIEQLNGGEYNPAEAARSLGMIKSDPKRCVAALVQKLSETNLDTSFEPNPSRHIIIALGKFGPAAGPAVPSLISALKDEDRYFQWISATALGQIGPSASEAAEALEQAFHNARPDDHRTRSLTLTALCALGPKGKDRARKLANDLADFTVLGIEGANIQDREILEAIAHAKGLRRLDLSYAKIEDNDLRMLELLPQLEELLLPVTTSDAGIEVIAKSLHANLKSLHVGRRLTKGYSESLAQSPLLISKRLTNKSLQRLTKFKNLQTLSIPISDFSDEGLKHLQDLPNIQDLCLGSEAMTDSCLHYLSPLKDLTKLNLSGTQIDLEYAEEWVNTRPQIHHFYLDR